MVAMKSYSIRRCRLNPDELGPVRDAALSLLLQLAEVRDLKTLNEAQALYRFAYRTQSCIRGEPAYPPHGTWEELTAQLWAEEARP